MDDIFSLHASLIYLLPKLIYTTAFFDTYFLIFRPWIIRPPLPSSQPSNSPSPMISSPVYALFHTLYLFLFWYSGLANEPWILVLQIPPFHLWASSICSVWIDTVRKREYEKRMEKDEQLKIENQSISTESWTQDLSIPWPQKLFPFLLFPMQTAAASDAALILLADRAYSTDGASWLEENSIRTYLIAFAISILSRLQHLCRPLPPLPKIPHPPLAPPLRLPLSKGNPLQPRHRPRPTGQHRLYHAHRSDRDFLSVVESRAFDLRRTQKRTAER